jgi:hypothetical protein
MTKIIREKEINQQPNRTKQLSKIKCEQYTKTEHYATHQQKKLDPTYDNETNTNDALKHRQLSRDRCVGSLHW